MPASSPARPCIPAQGSGAIAIGSEDHRPRHGGDHAGKRPNARLDHRADEPERLHRWVGGRRQKARRPAPPIEVDQRLVRVRVRVRVR
eukprot:scaffold54666_cov68-Phaeocystis_antarctica.AAC.1